MTTARYAIAFSVTAALLSLFSVRILYPVPEADEAAVAITIPSIAAAFAAAFTWIVGYAKGRDFGAVAGIVITLATFAATIATAVLLGRPASFHRFIQDVPLLLFWGLLLQGWYVLPIGAAVPWMARKVFGSSSGVWTPRRPPRDS